MDNFKTAMDEYRVQVKKGIITKAYRGLMEFMLDLRSHLEKKYPDYFVSGSLYNGYMDMTYFSFFPESLKKRKLKAGIVFIHEAFRFEGWLFGYNKQVQTKYWKLFQELKWNKYYIVPTTKNADSILEAVLVENPDFADLNGITQQIENSCMIFIKDIDDFLEIHDQQG